MSIYQINTFSQNTSFTYLYEGDYKGDWASLSSSFSYSHLEESKWEPLEDGFLHSFEYGESVAKIRLHEFLRYSHVQFLVEYYG